jgi:cysteine desulfurase/selenocysteine lyase
MVAAERGVELRWLPIDPTDGTLRMEALGGLLADGRVRLVAVAHASNVLGTINPVGEIVTAAHAAGALVLADGAQAAAHFPPRVADLGCDFYACSAHKMLGPTGVGALYARAELLEAMPAWMGGGDMIRSVSFDGWQPNEIPYKFEAGTPPIVEEIGFGAAVDFLNGLGHEVAASHERGLTDALLAMLHEADGVQVFGPPTSEGRVGAVSFVLDDVHPHDIATILDSEGVCVRAGHHCAQPLMGVLGVPATTRASLHVYNDLDDVEQLARALHRVREIFA